MRDSGPRYSVARRHKRVPVAFPASVEANGGVIRGICVDLSAGGAGLDLATVLEVGALVEVRIQLPDGEILSIQGEVRHAGEAGARRCGMRFGQLEPRSLVALHSLVAAK